MQPPWRKLKWQALELLVKRRNWRWYLNKKGPGAKLQLVCPRGRHWDFTLCGGIWIRPTINRTLSVRSPDAYRDAYR